MNYQNFLTHVFKLGLLGIFLTIFFSVGYSLPKVSQEIRVTGYYYLEEKVGKPFPEILYIHLFTIDDRGKRVPLDGFVKLNKRKAADYKMKKISLQKRDLTFTTKAVKGIHYEFNGKFLTDEVDGNIEDIVLKGNLKKFQGGKLLAESNVGLTYFTGD